MKNILITGADGFIGSHLTELLLEEGYHVKALVCYNSFNFRGWLEDLTHKNLEVVAGDIRDPHLCEKLTDGMDTVFHLAALIAIPFSYRAPDLYIDTNIRGTVNMCQAALKSDCRRFIQVSTSEVYGTAQYVPIDEKHPKQPQSPYSASKISADAMALSFHLSFGLPVTVARPFNTYGPRQSARAVIPAIITQILSGKNEIFMGDLRPTRDFNYVTDTCRALLSLAKAKDTDGMEVNIATGTEISIGDLFKKINAILGRNTQLMTEEQRIRPPQSEVFRLVGDNSLLRKVTGYQPAIPLDRGLELTCEWFGLPGILDRYKPDIYNI